MTFGAPETAATGTSSECLALARARLAESSDMAERAVRFHLAEALVLELTELRKEIAALRQCVESRG